jgi:cell division protein FtsB
MRLATTAALIVTAFTLSACDNTDLERAIAGLTGDLDELHDRETTLRKRYHRLEQSGTATDAEMNKLRQQYAALALQLTSGAQP